MTTSYDIETTIHPNGVVEIHGIETEYELNKHGDRNLAMCGSCGRVWDDSVSSDVTPVPSGRCPFEYDHLYTEDDEILAFLAAGGYNSPEDWARDSDYHFADGDWRDEADEPVDVLEEIAGAMEAAGVPEHDESDERTPKFHVWYYGPNEVDPWIVSAEGKAEPEAFATWREAISSVLGTPDPTPASDAELFIAANPSMGLATIAARVAELWAQDAPSTYRNRKVCELVRETLETGELPSWMPPMSVVPTASWDAMLRRSAELDKLKGKLAKLETANAMLADSLNTLSAENRRREQEIENLRRLNGNQYRVIQTIREIDPELVRRVQDGEV